MTREIPEIVPAENLAELLEQLGGIPPERVRLKPPPVLPGFTVSLADLFARTRRRQP